MVTKAVHPQPELKQAHGHTHELRPDRAAHRGEGVQNKVELVKQARPPFDQIAVEIVWIWAALARHYRVIVWTVLFALMMAAGFALLKSFRPAYTATGELIIDMREPAIVSFSAGPPPSTEAYVVNSHVELIKSKAIADVAIARCCGNNPDARQINFMERVLRLFGSAVGTTDRNQPESDRAGADAERLEAMTDAEYLDYLRKIEVNRKGQSAVIEVKYTTDDAVAAAEIVNSVMRTYVADQKRVKVEVVEKLNAWLSQKVLDLRSKMQASEKRLREFASEQAATEARATSAIYSSFLTRAAEMESQQLAQMPDARIITMAETPSRASGPNFLTLVLLGGLLGGVGGSCAALLQAWRDPIIREESRLDGVTGIRVFGTVRNLFHAPADEICLSKGSGNFAGNNDLLRIWIRLNSAIGERSRGGASKVIAVASSVAGEGKTTFAWNIANLASEIGGRVLLVNADCSKSSCGGLQNGRSSLIDALMYGGGAEEVIKRLSSSNLSLLPSPREMGDIRPASLMASGKFNQMITRMSSGFDYVIIDTESFTENPAVAEVLRCADAVVVMIRPDRSKWSEFYDLLGEAAEFSGSVLGVVLNVPSDHDKQPSASDGNTSSSYYLKKWTGWLQGKREA